MNPVSDLLLAIVGLTIRLRSRWRTFIGASESELRTALETALDELGWSYHRTADESTAGEQIWFGSEDSVTYEVTDPDLVVECIPVTFDAVSKFALRFTASEETVERYRESACLLDVSPTTPENEGDVAALVHALSAELSGDPWVVEHPRFSTAPLLRYKVKLLWRYWLRNPIT